MLYLHEDDKIQKQIDPGSTNKESPHWTNVYGNVDIAVAEALMLTAIQHKFKPTRDKVRKAMLKSVSTYMLEIKFGKNKPPPAPPEWSDWINADYLLDQTAVAAGRTPSAPTDPSATRAKVEVLLLDQKTVLMLNEQVHFPMRKKMQYHHQLKHLGKAGTRKIR